EGEGCRRPCDLPAGEVAAVEQGSESSLDDRPGDLRDGDDYQWEETGDDTHDFPGQRCDSVLAVSRYFSILATTSGFAPATSCSACRSASRSYSFNRPPDFSR